MATPAGLITRDQGLKTVIEVDTENIDYRNCESLKTTVAGVLRQNKKHVILNLQKVSFMDSSGLGVLLFCKRSCDEVGGSFTLCCLQGYVNNLVTLTKLDKAVTIVATEEEALAR